ncbi:MAG: hypothetical protein ACRDBG_23540 [Waterburya sp.]
MSHERAYREREVKEWCLENFKPDYTPMEMLKLGVFGTNYFDKALPEDYEGLTEELVIKARMNVGNFYPGLNHYKVKAGQDYEEWVHKGWIFSCDRLGWFHWYCRWYSGRRLTTLDEYAVNGQSMDVHQIKRWIAYKKRWLSTYKGNSAMGNSPVVAQGLLQWGILV